MKFAALFFFGLILVGAVPQAKAKCILIDRDIQLDGSFATVGSVPFTPDNSGKKFSAAIDINYSRFKAVAELTPTGINLTIDGPNGTSVGSFLKPMSLMQPPVIDLLDGFKSRFAAEWEAEISCDYKH